MMTAAVWRQRYRYDGGRVRRPTLTQSSLKTFSALQGEDEEAKRNVSMSQERQRTLEKLRSLRQVRHALIFDPPVAVSDLLPLTPPTALPGSGDLKVQPAAPESASEPEEERAAQHSGGQRPDRVHLGPARTVRSS